VETLRRAGKDVGMLRVFSVAFWARRAIAGALAEP
jgi:hypothetical protein